jgi:hypothetical protein
VALSTGALTLRRGDVVRVRPDADIQDWSGVSSEWRACIMIYTGAGVPSDPKESGFRFIGPSPQSWHNKQGFNLDADKFDVLEVLTHADDIPND